MVICWPGCAPGARAAPARVERNPEADPTSVGSNGNDPDHAAHCSTHALLRCIFPRFVVVRTPNLGAVPPQPDDAAARAPANLPNMVLSPMESPLA